MRFAVLLPLLASLAAAGPLPPELAEVLPGFRTEGTRGWAFVQTTEADNRNLVEHYDPIKPEVQRWTLLRKDGRDPTEAEVKEYRERQTRRSGGETAPNVKEQIDPGTCELVADDGVRASWRFRLKPGGSDDRSAAHMAVTFTLHRPTGTIERVELASIEPFSPVFSVRIAEARTVISYSLPEVDRPTLLQSVTMRVRGRALWFKSLDSDMTVVYSDYRYAGR